MSENVIYFVGVALGTVLGFFIGFALFYKVVSKQPIKPTIKIVTEKGIGNTTYIYRR